MENSNIKEILIQPLYEVLNSADVLTVQQMVHGLPETIQDRFSYDQVNLTLIAANKAIKMIETARKELTEPLDQLKKQIMDVERPIINQFKEVVNNGKIKMLEYDNELVKKQIEATIKIKKEAEEALNKTTPDVFATLAGYFVDQVTSIRTEQPTNIRTIKKAQIISDVLDVDWQMVVECLIKAGNFNYEILIKDLYKSMNAIQLNHDIKGIEIVEHKTKIIK